MKTKALLVIASALTVAAHGVATPWPEGRGAVSLA